MARVRRSLAVVLGGVELPTPVMIASGCAGTGRELSGLVDLRKVGGLVSRTIHLHVETGEVRLKASGQSEETLHFGT